MKEQCDVCLKKKEIKYIVDIPDGYLEVCSKTCARKELIAWIPDMIRRKE